MSTENPLDQSAENEVEPTEIQLLKEKAKAMGISHSPNIGVEKLRAMIEAKKAEVSAATSGTVATTDEPRVNALTGTEDLPTANSEGIVAVSGDTSKKTKSLRQHLLDTQTALVRLRITNMDPKKKNVPGEILTVANEYIGTIRKYVPFGEQTDGGFHVPFCLYQMMKERTFLEITEKKGKNGPEIKQRWVREFALEVLEPLTDKEIARLAQTQAARGDLD